MSLHLDDFLAALGLPSESLLYRTGEMSLGAGVGVFPKVVLLATLGWLGLGLEGVDRIGNGVEEESGGSVEE